MHNLSGGSSCIWKTFQLLQVCRSGASDGLLSQPQPSHERIWSSIFDPALHPTINKELFTPFLSFWIRFLFRTLCLLNYATLSTQHSPSINLGFSETILFYPYSKLQMSIFIKGNIFVELPLKATPFLPVLPLYMLPFPCNGAIFLKLIRNV